MVILKKPCPHCKATLLRIEDKEILRDNKIMEWVHAEYCGVCGALRYGTVKPFDRIIYND